MKININRTRSYGLEMFKVYVNGTYATEFPSIGGARTWALAFLSRNK